MATARSVAIIGGGIGGLSVAHTLIRAGMTVSLYERSPYYIPTAGAGFALQPNGQICLSYMGLRKETEQIVHPFHKWQMINDNGEVISTSYRLDEFGKRFGYFLGGTVRADLVNILKEPIEKTNNLHYSHHVTNIQQDSDGVTISFGNEHKPVRVDMVIGADGIYSTVARQIFSETAPPVHSKENIFYGIIDNIDEQKSIKSPVTAKHTFTQHFSSEGFTTYRVGNKGQFMWAATYPSDTPPATSGDMEWAKMNNQRELNRILKRFKPSHPVHQCAEATDKQRLLHFGLYYRQHRNDGWHRNRVCLLGDSCHATLPYAGQGANMAIEDAITLALCLEKHNFQIEPAYDEYFKKRFRRTKLVVDSARYMGLFFRSKNSIIQSIRQRLMPWMMNSNLMVKMTAKELYKNCPVPMDKRTV